MSTPTSVAPTTSRRVSSRRASRSSWAATGVEVTAGYAIKYADELNYVFLGPDEIAERMAEVRARCETEGRDPATLRFSLYSRDEDFREAGQARVDLLGGVRGDRAGPDHLLPDPLVTDARGAGGVRRGLPRGRADAQRLTAGIRPNRRSGA